MTKAAIYLKNLSGLAWLVEPRPEGYSLGGFSYHGKPVEAPLTAGVLALRNTKTSEKIWLPAKKVGQSGPTAAHFAGQTQIGGVLLSFELDLALAEKLPAACLAFRWWVESPLEDWEVCLAYHDSFRNAWNGHLYPWEEDSKFIQQAPLIYPGVPAGLFYRDDLSLGLLYSLDPASDYLNPTSWTGTTGLHFLDGVIPPQFRVCGKGMQPGTRYEFPLQIILNDTGDSARMITGLVQDWIAINHFQPETLFVRTPEQALRIFLEGRRLTSSWHPGIGYKLEEGDPHGNFVYLGEQPLSAYFEYLIYELTGDVTWRLRCFEQMDFLLQAQETNPASRHYGAFHTAYDLWKLAFDSDDRGRNVGYKPDLNAYMARYILLTWQRVKEREGLDRQDWYTAAVRAVDWVLRQRNPDGGLPQKVDIRTGSKSISVASGRALPAFPVIAAITGDERYWDFARNLEEYLVTCAEGSLRFTAHHPDLSPDEIEEASIYGAIEYWLDEYERSGRSEALQRALADAYLSLLWWCPKQLSWVKNPTQLSSAEQQHFLQYSIYCYQNRKVECLHRLAELTGDPLWQGLSDRLLQGIFWTQITQGDQMGATYERIADPWLQRADHDKPADFNSLGSIYIGEQSLDTMLQLLEMGYKPAD